MKTFREFTQLDEAVIKAKGDDAPRQVEKYVKPFLSTKNSHTLAKDVEGIKKGSKVTLVKHKVKDGVHHVEISHSKLKKNISVPVSHLNKPEVDDNKGVTYERKLIKKLKSKGLMDKKSAGAGNTAGNDFHLIDARGVKHKGKSAENHTGETKENLKAAFGQVTIHHSKEKGWHIPEDSKKNRPKFSAALERATVTDEKGVKRKFLDHLNKHVGAPKDSNKSKNVYSDHTDLQPVHDYLHDHHVGILHVGSHGTFRAGKYQKKDHSGVNFPEVKGKGKFRARFRKNRPGMFIEFRPHEMEKSHLDLMNDDHVQHIRKKLGHE